MIIIPAMDIYQNKIVRLKEGDFTQVTSYTDSPINTARRFEENGFQWLHIVDLIGSKTGAVSIINIIEGIKARTKLKIEFGGGVRDQYTAERVFAAGVDKLIIGSLSVQNKKEFEKIVSLHGPDKIIAAIDTKDEFVAVKGWTEQTTLSLQTHIEYCLDLHVDTFLCTDISKDGLLGGINLGLYKKLMEKFPSINLIASGGIKDIQDVVEINKLNPYAVVIGKAIYENKINLKELSQVGK